MPRVEKQVSGGYIKIKGRSEVPRGRALENARRRETERGACLRSTYFSVSLVLQVEQEKQLTHQALFRADTTVEKKREKKHKPVLGAVKNAAT